MTGTPHAQLDAFLAGVERRAFRMAQIATGERDMALDLVQDSMLQLARRYAQRPGAEWRPLFFRILENRITDWHRQQKRHRQLFVMNTAQDDETSESPDGLPQAADGQPDPSDSFAQGLAMQKLEAALRGLPERQHQAFRLRIWEGLDVADTARAMGVSDGSVKTHLSRALHRLRTQLKGYWP
ncbi:MAG: RNA polymerase sigma factor [Nevskiales bacterium]